MAAEDRTISGTDETAQAALDWQSKKVVQLWEQSQPLWKRWASDPNVRGDDRKGQALRDQGVREKVHMEIDGGDAVRQRVDFLQNTSTGRADQTADFLAAGNAVTQTLTHSVFFPRLFQGWIGIGFQDKTEIQGGAAGMYNYVKGKFRNNLFAMSQDLSQAIYGYGYVTDAVGTFGARSLDGIFAACSATNVASMQTAADGYYGGINRITAANSDWRGNLVTINAPLQPSDLQNIYTLAQDGNDAPTLIISGRTPYNVAWNFYEAKQRIMNNADPTLGKSAPLSFDGVSWMLDKTLDHTNLDASGAFYISSDGPNTVTTEIGQYTNEAIYFLNENYFKLYTWKGASGPGGSPLVMPDLQSTTNLNTVNRAVWIGTLACERPDRQGILISVTA